jgi:hypothetical protein
MLWVMQASSSVTNRSAALLGGDECSSLTEFDLRIEDCTEGDRKMSKKIFGLLALTALLLPVAAKADAISPAWEFNYPAISQNTNGDHTLGLVFTVTQNIEVGFLGYYDPAGGMIDSHEVGLYNSSGTLLASTDVTSASAYSSANFLYNAITPIELIAGQTYVIEGVSGADYYTNNVTGFTLNEPLTLLGTTIGGATMTYNGITPATGNDYFGADFGAVPEPGSLLLLGSGLLGLAGMLRRKLLAR